jgi:multidrug resistance efflux pump
VADENILAGMTAEQADADIAAREAKVEQLEATLRGAKDNLKAARGGAEALDEVAQAASGLPGVEAGAGRRKRTEGGRLT